MLGRRCKYLDRLEIWHQQIRYLDRIVREECNNSFNKLIVSCDTIVLRCFCTFCFGRTLLVCLVLWMVLLDSIF